MQEEGMRIGWDAKRAFSNTSGLGNYARTLIGSMLQYYPDHSYFAFTPAGERAPEEWPGLRLVKPASLPARAFPALWRTWMLAREIAREQLTLYHGLSNELPWRIPPPTRSVVTIHDLIFLRFPEWYPATDRKIYERKFRHACKVADAIVAVSRQTKDDLVRFFGIDPARISVVYQSCSPRFSAVPEPGSAEEFRKNHRLPEKYLLSVGTIEERKNLMLVLEALRLLPDVSLVAVGRKKKYFREVEQFIDRHGLSSRVHFPENVDSALLPGYYRCAGALVYPSRFEGFGIPILEALWSGTPVIAARTSALPEAGGPSSLYVEPDDAEALAHHARHVFEDLSLRGKMIADGRAYAQQFHPRNTAAALMAVYRTLA